MAEITGKGGSPDTAEASLPKLKLTEASRSPKPIIEIKGMSMSPDKIITIQTYGEYTIVLATDSKEIQILDEKRRKVEGLQTTQTMIVDWPALAKGKSGKESNLYIATDPDKLVDMEQKKRAMSIWNLSSRAYNVARALIGSIDSSNREVEISKQVVRMPTISWQIDTARYMKDKTTTIIGNGYIIFYQVYMGNINFIAFQTKNPKGTEVDPKNWIRFDSVDSATSNLGQNAIAEPVEHFQKLKFDYTQQLGNGFCVIVNKEDLTVSESREKYKNVEFTDKLSSILNNVCEDPKNKGIIYYCSSDNSRSIFRLDTNKDKSTWQTEVLDIPQEYKNILNLQLDSTGSFFTFQSNEGFVILAKDTLQEMQKVPKLYGGKLDDQERIRGIDEKGHLVVYDINFQEVTQELRSRRNAQIAKGLISDLFKQEATADVAVKNDQFRRLEEAKKVFELEFNTQLQDVRALEGIPTVSDALIKLRTRLQEKGLQPAEIEFITQGIQDSIGGKQRELAAPIIAQGLTDLNGKLSGNLTLVLLSEAKADLAKLKSLEGFVDAETRAKIITLEKQFSQQSDELYRRESPEIERYGRDILEREIKRLEQIVSKPDFDDWQDHTLPQQLKRIGTLINDYPPDGPPETLEQLMAFGKQLRDMNREYEIKFKEKYAEVRQKGSEIMDARIGLMKVDMNSFADRLRAKGFKDRMQAEAYVSSSEALGILRSEIAVLAEQNPDKARELDRTLKVQIANIMFEIERGGLTTIAETGQQMERFGNTLFPIWEGKVHEKTKRQFSLAFIADKKSMGVTPDKILGDIGIKEINSRGKIQDTRLYQGMRDEDKYRLGSAVSNKGIFLSSSYITQAEFREIVKDYADWNKGDASNLRRDFKVRVEAIKDWHKRKQEIGRGDLTAEGWETKYKELLNEYAKFSAEKHILIFNRIDNLKKAPETAFANGKGAVEEWKDYWVRDKTTERDLEEMAQISKMQLKQQRGMLGIRGYPGTGKDVRVSMFSFRTNRPYFPTDCSRWDTPYEFSEDIVLESVDGASQTVHVPSIVLNGITTPGAIVYFNELHALTEPAQIFLHALTDAKRRITLKTSSGRVVKALDSVILMASMNPQVKDPLEPALRDRIVFMDVDYPPLYREKDPADPNPNPPIDASEALRIAREVDSLSDLTIESNMDRNEFVRMWDKYINGIDNGASNPSKVQEFDMNVILAIVQFSNKLRENFVAFKSGRSQIASKALPVSLPATGRPLGDCADGLSSIPDEQKITGKPEAVARNLLERWFLRKMDNIEDREKIKTAMATWTSSKRPAA